jgi:hypothetical protein
MLATWTLPATCSRCGTSSASSCGRASRENERGWMARLTVDDEVFDGREFRRCDD